MTTKAPTSIREALAAQALEEIDDALQKVEVLTRRVDVAAETVGAKADALDAAALRYREAITSLNAQAKTELKEFLQATANKSAAEQKTIMEEAARHAFSNDAIDRLSTVTTRLEAAAGNSNVRRFRIFGIGFLCGMVATATGVIIMRVLG